MAKTVGTLAYQIVADTKDFTNGMVATKRELRAASQIIEAMKSPVDKLAEAEQALTVLYQKRALTLDQYTSALHNVREEHKALTAEVATEATVLERQKGMFERLVPTIDPVDLALRAVTKAWQLASAAAEFFTGKIGEQLAAIDEIGNAAQSLGMSFNEFVTLKHLAVDADVEFESLTKSLGKMEQAITKAGQDKKLAQLFSDLGLSVADLQRMSPAEAFGKIGDAIGRIDDPMASLTATMQVFGKSGFDIARLMGTTTEAMAEAAGEARGFGLTIDELPLGQIGELDNAWNEVGERMTGVWRIATVQLAPALLDIVNELNRMLAAGDQEGLRVLFTDLASAVRITAEATKGMASAVKSMADTVAPLLTLADRLGFNPLSTAQQAAGAFGAAAGDAALQRHMEEMAKPITLKPKGGVASAMEEEIEAVEDFDFAMREVVDRAAEIKDPMIEARRELTRLQNQLLELQVGKDQALVQRMLFGDPESGVSTLEEAAGHAAELLAEIQRIKDAQAAARQKEKEVTRRDEQRFSGAALRGSQEAIKLLAGAGDKVQEKQLAELRKINENLRREQIVVQQVEAIA